MSDTLFSDLRWLPRAPDDLRKQCEAAVSAPDPVPALMRLANCALSEVQLRKVATTAERIKSGGRSFSPLTPFKLGIVGNATLEPLVPAFVATALRHGVDLECTAAAFGQTLAEALAPDSTINRARPDAVLIALDHRGLHLTSGYDATSAATAVDDAMSFVNSLRDGFRTHSGAVCIVQTVAAPPETIFGSMERQVDGTPRNLIAAFNAALCDSLRSTEDVILDVAGLAETVGLANWHAPTQWNIGKFSFDAALLPLYADHVCRLIGAMRGKSRKCLVLDLDNTLWGGVIGDDGLEGIVIGQGDATGEAHSEVQRTALQLRDRGIVLAVSSKNTDEVARAAFLEHPEMLLREQHIAVFQANWNDKATNIVAIAAELALGVDSMVFLDDNPVERNLVRTALPQVAVPELPENPALFARTLLAAGYFESVAFSDEDRKRADLYRDNARRVALQTQVADMDSYLESLNMEIVFRPFDATGRSRISQLINKSNQFNLTTRRYTETDVAQLESDAACFTLQVRLIDTFGDNGMISVIVCRPAAPDAWEIDTWLMSCRVLGRKVEQMILREIALHAAGRGISKLIGRYLPSPKNAMVKDHYEQLGFRLIERNDDGSTAWEFAVGTPVEAAPMVVDRSGFEYAIAG